jgi:hypothetical protein
MAFAHVENLGERLIGEVSGGSLLVAGVLRKPIASINRRRHENPRECKRCELRLAQVSGVVRQTVCFAARLLLPVVSVVEPGDLCEAKRQRWRAKPAPPRADRSREDAPIPIGRVGSLALCVCLALVCT